MGSIHAIRFPGETEEYRQARDELLQAELDLRRRTEETAALRRQLPLGGEVPQDYLFEEGSADLEDRETVTTVRLSQLFAPDKDTLLLYNFMYGPHMEQPCPMCTSLIDGLNGNAEHVRQRASFAVVARSPIQRLRDFARERGWSNLRLLSSANNTFNRDYHGEDSEGGQNPVLHVFVRRDGRIHHFYSSELLWAPGEPGQDSRHVDPFWPLWNLLDVTPEGRGTDWYPQLRYEG